MYCPIGQFKLDWGMLSKVASRQNKSNKYNIYRLIPGIDL